jgi:hypothetical protein
MKNRMSYSIFVLAIIAALFSSSHALLKLDVSPIGTKLLSSKNANWDTVEVQVYVYNSGDTTYYNKGTTPLLYVEIKVDTLSIAKQYLLPGDSIKALFGFKVTDTVTVIKTPFSLVTWVDPLVSFYKLPAVSEMRVSSMYVELHPKRDTTYIAGCEPGTYLIKPFSSPNLSTQSSVIATTIYNVIGKPIWTGKSQQGRIPGHNFSAGTYLMVQGSENHIFRIAPQ